MGAVTYRFAAELRRRWMATLALVLLVGVAGGGVLATLAGARRTASSYTRLLSATSTSDVLVSPDSDGFPLEEARRLPQVRESTLITGTPLTPIRNGVPDYGVWTTGVRSDGRFGYALDRQYDLRGRMPKSGDEVFLNSHLASRLGLDVGDRARFRHVVSTVPSGAVRTEELTLTVSGVGTTVYETLQAPDQGYDFIFVGPAFAAAHPTSAPTFHASAVRLRNGARDEDAFARAVGVLAGGRLTFVQRQSATTAKAQQALQPYVGALAAFAGTLAITALLVLGQALSRHLALLAVDDPTLRATGMSRRQLVLLAVVRATAVGAGSALVAVAVAAAASPIMPIGPAHEFEPAPGLSLDGLVLPVGAAVLVALVACAGLAGGWRRNRHPMATGAPARSRPPGRVGWVETLAFRLRPAPATGLRLALDPGRYDRAIPARATVAGATLGMAAVVASLTFGASLGHFVSTPSLYGWAWDAQVAFDREGAAVLAEVAGSPGVSEATPGRYGLAYVAGVPVPAVGLGNGEARLHPPLLAGRAPADAGEVVLGTDTLRQIGRSVGDRVAIGVGSGTVDMRIVGRATFPRFAPYPGADKTGLGVGAQFTLEGLARTGPAGDIDFVLVRLSGGPAAGARLQARLDERLPFPAPFGPRVLVEPQRPDDLLGYDRVDRTPLVLAGLLALLAVGATTHGLVTAIHRRRRDLAVLRAVGFTAADVRAALRWQAAVVAAVAVAVGVPLGIAGGRLAWAVLGDRLSTGAPPVIPLDAVVVRAVLALAVALAISEIPARRASRARPAVMLRAE